MSPSPSPRVDVVALLTSARGLAALSQVLRDLPTGLGATVLIQQHLPNRGSQLAELLGRQSGRIVEWARPGEPLLPGAVLVCPPGQRMELQRDGVVAVLPCERGALDFPHDALLSSLARVYAGRALAVVLTGMGHDGAAGTADLIAAGGRVLVQDLETAEQPSMPAAAAAAGASQMLPLGAIGAAVAQAVTGGALP